MLGNVLSPAYKFIVREMLGIQQLSMHVETPGPVLMIDVTQLEEVEVAYNDSAKS